MVRLCTLVRFQQTLSDVACQAYFDHQAFLVDANSVSCLAAAAVITDVG